MHNTQNSPYTIPIQILVQHNKQITHRKIIQHKHCSRMSLMDKSENQEEENLKL